MIKLPEKWCIIRNKENFKEVNEYFSKVNNKKYTANGEYFQQLYTDYMHFPKIRDKVVFSHQRDDYTLITFEQFKKFIMNEEQFKLPDTWWVRVTQENKDVLWEWLDIKFATLHPNKDLVGMVHRLDELGYHKSYNPINKPENFDGSAKYTFGKEITYEQFKKYVLKSVSEKEFILPERWCIKVNKENIKTLIEWRGFISGTEGYIFHDKLWNRENHYHTEITYEQFKKYVLMKKITGYKLVKTEYLKIAGDIGADSSPRARFDNKNTNAYNSETNEYCLFIDGWEYTIEALKKAGVLDLWFEPVYEETLKLPKINNHEGIIKGNYVVYGCAELPIEWFKIPSSRGIKSFTTTNNVYISEQNVEQIRKVILNKKS